MSDIYVSRFFCSVCRYYKTLSNRIDFDGDSECSSERNDGKIKQEVEKDDCNTSANY